VHNITFNVVLDVEVFLENVISPCQKIVGFSDRIPGASYSKNLIVELLH